MKFMNKKFDDKTNKNTNNFMYIFLSYLATLKRF